MTEQVALEIYKLLLAERENDGKRLWVLFGLMNLINGGLLAIVSTKEIHIPIVKPGIFLLGFIISLVWLGVQTRMVAWLSWWEGKLIEIEEQAFKNNACESLKINVFRDRKLDGDEDGISTRVAAQFVPIVFTFLWAFLLFWHFSK